AAKLTADFPKVPSYPEHSAYVHEKQSFLAGAMQRPQEGEEEYRRAIEVTERVIAAFPQMADHTSYVARLLIRTPYPRLRNPQRALELAKKIPLGTPEKPDAWTLLGMAYYQVENWKEASANFEKSVQLSKGGDAETLCYLAMTYAKLKDRSKAE